MIISGNNGQLILQGVRSNKVWIVPQVSEYAHSFLTKTNLLHERLGRSGRHTIMRMAKAVTGIVALDNLNYSFCRAYKEAKMPRKMSREPMMEVSRALERAHMDICGHFRKIFLHGDRYMLTITDHIQNLNGLFLEILRKISHSLSGNGAPE